MQIAKTGPGPAPGPGLLGKALLTASLFFLLAPALALAHGVELSSGLGQTAWIQANYAGGEPMEFAKVRVTDPQGRTHQVGNADAKGRFAWLADQDGDWRVVAEDGMGHRGEIIVRAGQTPLPPDPERPQEQPVGPPLWMQGQLGLSFIFWLAGALFWWRGRLRYTAAGKDRPVRG